MMSPCTSWGGTDKLGRPPQTPPVSPDENGMPLVLGTMQVSRILGYSDFAQRAYIVRSQHQSEYYCSVVGFRNSPHDTTTTPLRTTAARQRKN